MSFFPNRNLAKDLEKEPEFNSGLAKSAEGAADKAKSFAPVRTGAYRDSIRVVEVGGKVYLSAFDFKAGWIEMGKANFPPLAPLRRGARAAGLRFTDK